MSTIVRGLSEEKEAAAAVPRSARKERKKGPVEDVRNESGEVKLTKPRATCEITIRSSGFKYWAFIQRKETNGERSMGRSMDVWMDMQSPLSPPPLS